jgi:dUTPase
MRIAQMVVAEHSVVSWNTTENLGEFTTDRGVMGFGSTGSGVVIESTKTF